MEVIKRELRSGDGVLVYYNVYDKKFCLGVSAEILNSAVNLLSSAGY
jgi:hypothetical protein